MRWLHSQTVPLLALDTTLHPSADQRPPSSLDLKTSSHAYNQYSKSNFFISFSLKKMTMNGIIAAVETGERKIKQRRLRNKVAERRGQQNLTI